MAPAKLDESSQRGAEARARLAETARRNAEAAHKRAAEAKAGKPAILGPATYAKRVASTGATSLGTKHRWATEPRSAIPHP